jgi:hypothetical protein
MHANKNLFAADERGLTPKETTISPERHGDTETRTTAKTFGGEYTRIKTFLPQMNAERNNISPGKHGDTETRTTAKTFGRECTRIKAFLPQMKGD